MENNYYLSSLLDENQKSVDPGGFEQHWGVFAYDGTAKYPLTVTGSPPNDATNGAHQQYSDCTDGVSFYGLLDARGNTSYAFNQYYQIQGQSAGSFKFNGLGSSITRKDPSVGSCKFIIQISTNSAAGSSPRLPTLFYSVAAAATVFSSSFFLWPGVLLLL